MCVCVCVCMCVCVCVTPSHIQFSVDKYACVFFYMYDVVLCFQTNVHDNCCMF